MYLFKRLFLAQGMDLLTFAILIYVLELSLAGEVNPIPVSLMGVGFWVIVAIKLGLPVYAYFRIKNTERKVFKMAISAATASGIVGAGFNLASIINSITGFSINL